MNLSECISQERREMMIYGVWQKPFKAEEIAKEARECGDRRIYPGPKEEEDPLKKLSQLLKDLSPVDVMKRVDLSIQLMGVVVEKLDEISGRLEKIDTKMVTVISNLAMDRRSRRMEGSQ